MLNLPKHYSYPKISPINESNNRPFWSVMIPTYNGSKYLEKTLNSILAQDPGSDEMQIGVIDDCSLEDNPEKLVRKIGKNRVDFYRQSQNVGIGANWNTCIQYAHGSWIHLLHQDDVVMPGFYRRFREIVEQEPSIGAAFCRNIYMDEDDNWQSLSPLERKTPGILSDWLEKIAIGCSIVCPAIVVKRSVYENLGGFHPEFKCALDWDMWKRIAINYPVWYEPQPLVCYRWHSASAVNHTIKSGVNIAESRQSIEMFHSCLPDAIADELSEQSKEHHAIFALHLAKQLLSEGNMAAVIAQIREGLKCSHSSTVLSSLASLLKLPEAEPLLKIIAHFFLSIQSNSIVSVLYEASESSQIESFNLKKINILIFFDWKQPEELLYQDLARTLKKLANHPYKDQIALLIDTSNISDEDAAIILSDVTMTLLLQEELDVTDGPEISLLGKLDKRQWEALLSSIHYRIALEKENTKAIVEAGAGKLPCCGLDDLNNQGVIRTEVDR